MEVHGKSCAKRENVRRLVSLITIEFGLLFYAKQLGP